jgi:hypothetical protein
MKTLIGLIAALILMVTPAAAQKSGCDCPKDDPATHGVWQVLVDKELSSVEKMPTSNSLGFPKVLTVCLNNGGNTQGYDPNLKMRVESSIDGRNWFPATLATTDQFAETTNGCLQITPTRFVRVGWPLSANVASPGPRVTASVQASY